VPSNLKSNVISEALRNFDSLPDSAHVRQPVVRALFACSSSTLYRGVSAGRIPAPLRFSLRTSVWNVGELRSALSLTKQSGVDRAH
jgi:predicted DNA-binding transcriptional regulator AlpA